MPAGSKVFFPHCNCGSLLRQILQQVTTGSWASHLVGFCLLDYALVLYLFPTLITPPPTHTHTQKKSERSHMWFPIFRLIMNQNTYPWLLLHPKQRMTFTLLGISKSCPKFTSLYPTFSDSARYTAISFLCRTLICPLALKVSQQMTEYLY